MPINKVIFPVFFLLIFMITGSALFGSEQIKIKITNDQIGAPITLGIPFAKGILESPDHVRVLDKNGLEIQSQSNLVTTWEPADYSVKWLWVFFFSTGDDYYILEYGKDIQKAPLKGHKIKIKNGQRRGQDTQANTGVLKFTVDKRTGGFIDDVLFDVGGDNFDGGDTIATSKNARGSFLDILDDLGIDSSQAQIHRTIRERGSGSLHTILRLEGSYTYNRKDNRESPFTMRIHLYAGKSYIRVFHTLTYTGIPDKHKPVPGQHANIALTSNTKIKDDSNSEDEGWTIPNDQIAATGISLDYNLNQNVQYTCGYREGSWHEIGAKNIFKNNDKDKSEFSVFQTGPKPDRIPPVPNSTMDERISGFKANISVGKQSKKEIDRASGWADLSDDKWGVSIGIKNFLEEYPKEISFLHDDHQAIAYLWSPKAGPMSFARSNTNRDQGMVANFAEGVTKTSELVIHFHKGNSSEIEKTMSYFLDPPIPHAGAETYAQSKVYGQFAPRNSNNDEYERSLDYKFDWELFNQQWEPWYGMFDYGDQKNVFFREDWFRWQNNEPAIDYMYWLQFMRTGNAKYYKAAEAMSRHTMDVDNIHWPADPPYYGDTNESLDYFEWEAKESVATPYLGIGRRHANQHWVANLSAHVWLQGWLASYYLTGYHRGLDIAKLTADSHTRRIWGTHGLRGRRLYLSIWNLVEAWDATKNKKYLNDLEERIDILLELQNGPDQYDNLAIDRYGYSQIYATHGLYKYYQMTGDQKIKQALIRHARAIRDNPPYNHEYESYLATIHGLVLGYEFTGEDGFLKEAMHRAEVIKTNKLKIPIEQYSTQKALHTALEDASNLPKMGDFQTRQRWVTNWSPTAGLRVFGWTHIYNIPWLMNWIENEKRETNLEVKVKD